MRFIQRKDFLEVHNHRATFPLSGESLGIALMAIGVIVFINGDHISHIAGIVLVAFGVSWAY